MIRSKSRSDLGSFRGSDLKIRRIIWSVYHCHTPPKRGNFTLPHTHTPWPKCSYIIDNMTNFVFLAQKRQFFDKKKLGVNWQKDKFTFGWWCIFFKSCSKITTWYKFFWKFIKSSINNHSVLMPILSVLAKSRLGSFLELLGYHLENFWGIL